MENIDLDIDNYDLDDILQLFHLNIHFDEAGLKQAYKITLMTHPDKSNLDKKYFLFFSNIFKILKQVHDFNHTKNKCARLVHDDSFLKNEEQALLAEKIRNKPHFNKWFNDMFEKIKIQDCEQDTGYDVWFRSEQDMNTSTINNMTEMNNVFEKKKAQCRELVLHKEIQDLGGQQGYNLSRSMPQNYGSEIFSKLQFEDLKKAHTETVVPVTHEDYINKQKFNNVNELNIYRSQNETPLTKEKSQQILQKQKNEQHTSNMHNAYTMAKQYENIKKANNQWWGSLRQLTET